MRTDWTFRAGPVGETSDAACSIPGASSMDRTGSAGVDSLMKEMQKGIPRDGYMSRNENSISGESDRSDIEDSRSCFPGSRWDCWTAEKRLMTLYAVNLIIPPGGRLPFPLICLSGLRARDSLRAHAA